MFATARHGARNKLSDLVQVNRNGKIAMKLEERRRDPRRRDLPTMTTCF
jgi:hypothetical protein